MKGWDNCPRCGGSGFTGSPLLCTGEPPAPAPSRRYIAEHWEVFERLCVPKLAPPEQRRDIRDAFYSGAYSIFRTLTSEVSNENDMTPDDERLMVCLNAEIEEHRAAMKARAERAMKQKGAGS